MSLEFRPPHVPRNVLGDFPDYESQWAPITEAASALDQRLARGGHLTSMLDEVREALTQPNNDAIDRCLRKHPTRARRAALVLWNEDRGLAERTMTPARASRVCNLDHPMSRLALRELLTLYWQYFSSIPSWHENLRSELTHLIWRHLDHVVSRSNIKGNLRRIHSAADLLLGDSAPRALSEAATSIEMPLGDFIQKNELTDIRNTEFGAEVVRVHYLRQIHNADPASSPPFLSELREDAGLESLMADGRFFGHHVIEAMAKSDSTPSDDWLRTILHIGGDPRLKNSSEWRNWWQPIAARTRDRVVQWLSRMDLKLFMEAFEEFTKDPGLEDLQRMFKDRKVFIEGLLELGLIRETRLFLGYAAHRHIRQSVGEELSDSVTLIAGNPSETGGRAVIAIDCGDFQLLEGSHNFQLWVYVAKRPTELFTRTISSEVSWKALREFAQEDKRPAHQGRPRWRGFRHRGSTWQYNAVKYLSDYGHRVPLGNLMSKESYDEYVRRHSVPTELL